MQGISVEAKKAYFARVRKGNFAESLRLEGIEAPSAGKYATKAEIIRHYRQISRSR
ncbi:YhfG family protein [Halomonas sp. NCCP-2165]|nr:YhfG family protein [Halomonas sp. NCCP-2165]GKW48567.1 hypothetical protein NCCP2165_07820 [Halomonas sp. NCCP-2165]